MRQFRLKVLNKMLKSGFDRKKITMANEQGFDILIYRPNPKNDRDVVIFYFKEEAGAAIIYLVKKIVVTNETQNKIDECKSANTELILKNDELTIRCLAPFNIDEVLKAYKKAEQLSEQF